jgi:tripartite-type tricarboxylate transporter receptor subunit TctC
MRILANLIATVLAIVVSMPASAQDWPKRWVKVIVPFAPGGATDLVARIVVKRMSELLGQPMPIENRPGAAGNIGVAAVAGSAPDGYTVLIGNVSTNALNPVMYARVAKVDPLKELEPVGGVAVVENVLVGTAAGTLPPNTFKEFIKYAQDNPGKLNYSSGGIGSYAHLDMLVLSRLAKLDMVHVPAVGGAGGSTNVQSGLVHTTFLNAANAQTNLRSKLVKAFAVTGPQRLSQLPDVPTLKELGFPSVGTANWAGMFVPKGTPQPVIKRLHQALTQALASPDVLKAFEMNGITASPNLSPEDYGRFVQSEHDRFQQIVRENNVPLL